MPSRHSQPLNMCSQDVKQPPQPKSVAGTMALVLRQLGALYPIHWPPPLRAERENKLLSVASSDLTCYGPRLEGSGRQIEVPRLGLLVIPTSKLILSRREWMQRIFFVSKERMREGKVYK